MGALNWSLSFLKYVGHPFHIHINDYQVKDADTELDGKRSLEDVTMLNCRVSLSRYLGQG